MCLVVWAWGGAPALWGGTFGTAKVIAGDEAVAITSDGVRHAL